MTTASNPEPMESRRTVTADSAPNWTRILREQFPARTLVPF
ncbi:MAG: hypothetical protein JWR83_2415, partial [Aeromicrobium sp.]|nr:hypothetical protein [Aeromicrobium sp.]